MPSTVQRPRRYANLLEFPEHLVGELIICPATPIPVSNTAGSNDPEYPHREAFRRNDGQWLLLGWTLF
ncbi:MAG: hypothetical protein U5L11_07930 [Arhodomonas sp.]|nr:hypothetical protein [Arhodomonas sp.]